MSEKMLSRDVEIGGEVLVIEEEHLDPIVYGRLGVGMSILTKIEIEQEYAQAHIYREL